MELYCILLSVIPYISLIRGAIIPKAEIQQEPIHRQTHHSNRKGKLYFFPSV